MNQDPNLDNSSTKNTNHSTNNNNTSITSLHNAILVNDDLMQISPKKRHFLQACEDTRPSTIGTVGPINYIPNHINNNNQNHNNNHKNLCHTTTATSKNNLSSTTSSSVAAAVEDKEHVWEVNYVGGWKRGRKQQQQQTLLTQKVDNNNNNNSSILHSHPTCDIKPAPVTTELSRASSICDTANLFTAIIKKQLRCIAFCKVRKLVELVLSYTINNLEQKNKDTNNSYYKNKNDNVDYTNTSNEEPDSDNHHLLIPYIASYRGGYTKEERRMIEYNLFHGKLLGVTATCALELGIGR